MASLLQGFEEVQLVKPVGKTVLTVTDSAIRFNKATAEVLGFPAYVKVLINDKTKQIAVTPTTAKADNAIKFSHHDSVIHIETSEKKNKLFVSVKDTGIGIPKEDLKLIWDRFYKSDLSRGKDKKGTGLGLSIVKEIINAHNEHINVISTPGVGSEFIFSLPKSHQEDEED